MDEYLSYLVPGLMSIAKALLLLILAFIVAAIVKKVISVLLARILPRSLREKNPDFCKNIVVLTAKISYIIVFLMFIPGIFAMLNMASASEPIIKMLEETVSFIPRIIVAGIIIYIGLILSKLLGEIVEKLVKSMKADEKIASLIPEGKKGICISGFCKVLVELLLVIFFIVQGIDVLRLEVFDGIGEAIIGYIPSVLAAALIFIGCFCLDSFMQAVLTKGEHFAIAMLSRVAIYVIGAFMILSQLGIAPTIVNFAFIIIITAIAVAFAVAFGIGGRSFAARLLEKLENSCTKDTHIGSTH